MPEDCELEQCAGRAWRSGRAASPTIGPAIGPAVGTALCAHLECAAGIGPVGVGPVDIGSFCGGPVGIGPVGGVFESATGEPPAARRPAHTRRSVDAENSPLGRAVSTAISTANAANALMSVLTYPAT